VHIIIMHALDARACSYEMRAMLIGCLTGGRKPTWLYGRARTNPIVILLLLP